MDNTTRTERESHLTAPGGHDDPQPRFAPQPPENRRAAVEQPARSGGAGLWIALLVVAALAIVGVLLWQRSSEHAKLASDTRAMATLTVNVIRPSAGPGENEIVLPGSLMAYSEAPIYARTNGYLKAWRTDIGAKVTEGQVMAEIDAPDVDAQLRQANAALAQSRANLEIANLNFERQKDLLQKKVSSQQEFDQNRTNVEAMKAAVQAGEANVQNLTVMKGFQEIKSPFDGVVTKRNTDVGALINTQGGTGQELFRVARTDILRVYVYVPQAYAAFVKEGSRAYLEFAEFPGEKFDGKVAHIAGALDPATRTLQTQIEVDNKEGRLFPGAFANTHLFLPLKKAPMVIPVNTLIFRSQGTQVGTVDAENRVRLKSVAIGQDYGTTLEVIAGISPEDRLILNPSDSLTEGAAVQVHDAASDAKAKEQPAEAKGK